MPTLSLDGHLLRSLIASRLPGRLPELQRRWWAYDHPDQNENKPPHRGTIHRWTQGQLPRTKEDLMRLCGVLDVDPVSLLKLPEGDPEATMERLATNFLHGRWDPPSLELLNGFLGRRRVWPPPELAQRYFGRPWWTQELAHDAEVRTNYYATLRIAASGQKNSEGPFVYHIGFRHPTLFGKRWLQYGVVLRHGKRVSLRHINGYTDACNVCDTTAPTLVETWFGPNPAIFRVASLHAFALEQVAPGTAQGAQVRFPG